MQVVLQEDLTLVKALKGRGGDVEGGVVPRRLLAPAGATCVPATPPATPPATRAAA